MGVCLLRLGDVGATSQRADGPLMRNPLRSEGDMFRLLLYVIAVFGTIIAIIVIARAQQRSRGTGRRTRQVPAKRPTAQREATPRIGPWPPRAGARQAPRRAPLYLTVSVPNMPAARWPGTWQKKV